MFTEFAIEALNGGAAPPAGAGSDWTIPQDWERFSAEEHRVWDTLFARQQTRLAGRAVGAFADGLDLLRLSRPGIPRLDELNDRLSARSGWTIVSVPGLVPDDVFFGHLSRRQFPAGNFIRPAGQLDYLEQPDVFHDLFGHVPMLADPVTADFVQALGALGVRARTGAMLDRLSRLYWYTIEFGLAREAGGLRIYGAGLASSFAEAEFALTSKRPRRAPFDLETVLRTRYRSDRFQSLYFVVDDLPATLAGLAAADLEGLLAGAAELADLDPETGQQA